MPYTSIHYLLWELRAQAAKSPKSDQQLAEPFAEGAIVESQLSYQGTLGTLDTL